MKRPYVQAKGTNIKNELLQELTKHLPLFQQYEGIAGIMLNGGISRGFADALSEIDVVVFLHHEAYTRYQRTLTPSALGITMLDNYLYDIKLCCYEDEMNRQYAQLELWDLSYAQILYDPSNELQQLFKVKLKETVDYSSAGGYLFDAWWHYRLAGDIWIAREDTAQGHYVLNAAITPLLSALFVINQEYIPHEKWIIHMSRTLPWLPACYDEHLEKILCVKDLSLDTLIHRQLAIQTLWEQLDKKLCELISCPAGINLMHLNSYRSLCELYERGMISVKDWNKNHSVGDLNYDPLNKLIKIDGDVIYFQYDSLNSITENEMYSWFYQIVEAFRNQNSNQ